MARPERRSDAAAAVLALVVGYSLRGVCIYVPVEDQIVESRARECGRERGGRVDNRERERERDVRRGMSVETERRDVSIET